MKKVEAIIRTSKFDAVRDALASIGVKFFSLKDVKGYGLQKGEVHTYRGADLGAEYIARIQMDLVVSNDRLEEVVKTIQESGRTGEIGDGKIFVFDVLETIRIRNGEKNELAI